ncbi:MAG: hypothetical protein LKJ69_04750 [Lactobacillus sp.]|jgi:hypothetical protein|nr:hypothetical protein [Lactobacillus sp.]MCI2032692.1 hypothetical protein [Lactobacillus sp.]
MTTYSLIGLIGGLVIVAYGTAMVVAPVHLTAKKYRHDQRRVLRIKRLGYCWIGLGVLYALANVFLVH